MNAKRVLIIVLIVSLLGMSMMQTVSALVPPPPVNQNIGIIIQGENDALPIVSQAFDIDDIDSPDIQ